MSKPQTGEYELIHFRFAATDVSLIYENIF